MPGKHIADSHDVIRVVGARENNLKDIDLELPKRRLTVFTGVSGSGKSSLVFDTIAAESQRLINETYSAFVQGFMPTLARPEVDLLEGLTTAIIVDQQRMGSDPRSTVGTATDAGALLRILFSRLGKPHIGSPQAFSFNVASISGAGAVTVEKDGRTVKERREFAITGGMCPRCEGRGSVNDFDLTALYDDSKSLNEGAITVPGYSMDGWYGRIYRGCGYFDPDKPIAKFTRKELDALLHKEPTKIKVDGVNLTYAGLIPQIRKSFLAKDVDAMQPHIRAFVEKAITFTVCPDCAGTRLSDLARSSKIKGLNIADVSAMQISDLAEWLRGVDEKSVAPLVQGLQHLMDSFTEIGLGYLSLDRPAGTLSGGEAQRTKMIRHLGSSLTDVTYVFDEPTIGLHPHDIDRMNGLLLRLRDEGNTVLVVEHKPETIVIADHVVDLGPDAGSGGGEVVFEGTVDGLRASGTVTGRHLEDRAALKDSVRKPNGAFQIRGAATNNLRDVDVDIPTGVLVVLTGVAGSGRSSLITGSVAGRDGVVTVDQSPIRGSRRSNPATYSGLLDPIRKAFAKANGVKPALFSSNSEGACPTCNGAGVIYTELGVMATVESPCEECEGRRFQASVLEHTLGGRNIAEVLAMPVAEAQAFFGDGEARTPAAHSILERLADVGLGYLQLGQPLTTLSGGERQRLKLATRLGDKDKADVFVLDEPTSGLHLADVQQLLGLLDRLVDGGRSVIVIEHHQAVMAHADWIIDLGPGAGHDGGRVVFEGTPEDLVANATTLTGEHLAAYVAG
ncbi:ATP-binding cassette domain-containing protein [Mycolicibacterium confluentis]|uniref:UvrABC system protein A n=1 Tax=Mycolicibacterium confluentis TaxID=28047 RepID=A0A7I7Y0P9_9MYCO|nr:excinuclease ABC subunit UvrA [Mycolicibacterium confluentis]MCV7319581.1 excinuclease ABC subunit UvrA [Mycolicibacterium confluentis]ORV34198.1 daunorubicin resistance protein DrrC [Mycolicibacterium confluentis]BBZ34602.1 ABC transporter ATP-binding protein [Mycolicibacterium confluentis]